ncbi:uncharacterized G-patch domain protein DDB_G0278987-like [Hetaerina americana]|uniref:uncharacterized G-patch domain protein DDB_G0278987-like n=1 Tax=Hetaerina americana TaxID=62018 RepID=UPI003A7F4B5B
MPRKMKSLKTNFSSTEVVDVVKKAISSGFSNALEWLVECLEEAAEDEEEEAVPLLPISEDAIVAMEDANFLKVLKILGIVEPNEEQEVYWRIPSSYKPGDLRSRAQAIDLILKNKEIYVPEPESSTVNDMDIAFSSLLAESRNVESNGTKSKGQKRKDRKYSSSSSGEDDLENFLKAVRKENETSLALDENVYLPSTSTSLLENKLTESSKTPRQKKKKRLIVNNESSSDDEVLMRSQEETESFVESINPSSITNDGNDQISSLAVGSNLNKKKKKIIVLKDDSSSDNEDHVKKTLNQNTKNDKDIPPSNYQSTGINSSDKMIKKKLLITDNSSSDDEILRPKTLGSNSKAPFAFKPTEEDLPKSQARKKKKNFLEDSSSSDEENSMTKENSQKTPLEKGNHESVNKSSSHHGHQRVKALISDDEYD